MRVMGVHSMFVMWLCSHGKVLAGLLCFDLIEVWGVCLSAKRNLLAVTVTMSNESGHRLLSLTSPCEACVMKHPVSNRTPYVCPDFPSLLRPSGG